MVENRIIPTLLLSFRRLVKTKKFRQPRYVGDPINAIRIFNDKAVDELIVLDIGNIKTLKEPDFQYLEELASEAFMPMAYGGKIQSIESARRLFRSGFEKVIVNSVVFNNPEIVFDLSQTFGSQSCVVAVDYKSDFLNRPKVFNPSARKLTKLSVLDHCLNMEDLGAGEIFLNSISREGTYSGYDLELLEIIAHKLRIPVIVSGGAGQSGDFEQAFSKGASACAAGSMFIYRRPHNAVLISYEREN